MSVPSRDAAMPPGAKWSPAWGTSIGWRQWDGECVVYLEACATTHLLDAAAGSVLKTLLETPRPLSFDEVGAHAFDMADADAGVAMSADELAALQAILLDLQRIGVAQPDSP